MYQFSLVINVELCYNNLTIHFEDNIMIIDEIKSDKIYTARFAVGMLMENEVRNGKKNKDKGYRI